MLYNIEVELTELTPTKKASTMSRSVNIITTLPLNNINVLSKTRLVQKSTLLSNYPFKHCIFPVYRPHAKHQYITNRSMNYEIKKLPLFLRMFNTLQVGSEIIELVIPNIFEFTFLHFDIST